MASRERTRNVRYSRFRAVVVLAATTLSAASAAGEHPHRDEPQETVETRPAAVVPGPYGFRRLGYDTRYLLRSPFRLDRRATDRLFAVGGVTVGLYLFRDDIQDWTRDHRSEGRGAFLGDARTMGKGAVAPALALATYVASFVTRNRREKETAQMLLESAGFSSMAAFTGQAFLATERPEDGDSIRLLDDDGHGVSLDAALAASVIGPLRCQYLRIRPRDSRSRRFWKRTASVLLYGGAALTAYQRVYEDKHWAPDAFLGTMAGLAVGRTLCRAHGHARARSPGGRYDPENP